MRNLTERLAAAVADRYAVQRELGSGGMATVYLAQDRKHHRPVALKVLHPELSAAIGADRFLSEIRVTANLQHPNILPLFDSGEADELLYYVMPFVEGESLRERVDREKQFSVAEAVRIASAVASALEYAHRQNVIHRDIKPANIMVRDDQVFVTDFGIALAVGALETTRLTATGLLVGTPQYMSPEQAAGDQPVSAASDVYALGSVVYELLVGVAPHVGPNVQAIVAKVFTEEPASIRAVRNAVPIHVERAVMQALAKVPADRFRSAADFAQALAAPAVDTVPAPSVACPKCRHGNSVGQRFCGRCGSLLEEVCGTCGEAASPDAAFCGRCGQSLGTGVAGGPAAAEPGTVPDTLAAPPRGALAASERRHATVVHSTIEEYARLVEHVDADELERVTDRLHSAAAEIVEKHNGVLNSAVADELVAVFGVPVAHEDDAHRAVRAAVELQQFVEAMRAEAQSATGAPIGVRTGISTGFVVARTSRREAQRFALAGDAVQLASRLAAHAAANDMLVSAETERLLVPFFTTEALEPITLGSGCTITPHRVVGESGLRSRLEAAERTGLTRFAGRDAEMGTLQACLEQALGGEGRVVSIVGDAGVGKSRLRYEFLRAMDPSAVRVVEGRCQSLGEMTPYLPFVEALRSVLDLEREVEQQADAVVERVRALDPGLEDFMPLYLNLLSIQPEEHTSSQRLTGEDLRLAILEGLAAVFTLASQQRPTVMLLEDWHWADDGSQEMLGQLAGIATAYPLLIVVTARPQGVPDLHHVDQYTPIRLGPLAESSSIAIMASILNVDHIAEDLRRHLHERTAGNPFFLEELCRAMQEEGVIAIATGQAIWTGSVDSLHLPDTVQAVLRSRLDRVDPDAREVLRLASVVGREFARATLERALPATIPLVAALETLKSLGMIQQIRVLPNPEYRFKHALTQEAAYESLVQHQRKTLHGLVGEVLEESYPDRAEEQPDVFAHHFSLAEQWERAVVYGRRAAEKAGDLSQFAEAARILENVHGWVKKLDDSDARREMEIDILLAWERASETTGKREQQRTIIDRLLALIQPGVHDRQLAETYIRHADLCTLLGQFAEAREALDRSIEMWRTLADPVGERNALRSLGFLGWHQGDLELSVSAAKAALAIDRERQDMEAVAQDLNNLGTVLKGAGRIDEALDHLEEAVQLFETGQIEAAAHHALVQSAIIYRDQGDIDKAMHRLQTALVVQRRRRLIREESFNMSAMASIAHLQGRSEEAISIYEDLVRRAREAQYATGLGQGLHGIVELLLALDRPRDALPYARESAEVFQRMAERAHEAAARQRLAEIYEHQLHDYASATAEWHKARTLCRATGNRDGELIAVAGVARLARSIGADVKTVIAHYQDALDLAVELDDVPQQGDLLNSLGVVRWQQRDYAESMCCYERALEIFRGLDDQPHIGLMLNSIGAVLRDAGRLDEALRPLQEALETNRKANQKRLEGHSLATLGDVHAAIGKSGEALVQYEASLELRRELEDRSGEGWMLFRIAQVEASCDRWDRALDFIGQARKIADEIDDERLQKACDDLSQ